MSGLQQKPTGRHMSFGRAVQAVAWSFLGIRKKSELQADFASINPLHIILVGVLGTLIFIGLLVAVISWVVAK